MALVLHDRQSLLLLGTLQVAQVLWQVDTPTAVHPPVASTEKPGLQIHDELESRAALALQVRQFAGPRLVQVRQLLSQVVQLLLELIKVLELSVQTHLPTVTLLGKVKIFDKVISERQLMHPTEVESIQVSQVSWQEVHMPVSEEMEVPGLVQTQTPEVKLVAGSLQVRHWLPAGPEQVMQEK